jgi:hypothetical protein
MPKLLKLAISIFIGFDLFVLAYLGLAQLRYQVFGQGEVPGIGSAFDMAIFLFPLLMGYVAGDRLYHFLTYRERKAANLRQAAQQPPPGPESPVETGEGEWELAAGANRLLHKSAWEDRGWDDEERKVEK